MIISVLYNFRAVRWNKSWTVYRKPYHLVYMADVICNLIVLYNFRAVRDKDMMERKLGSVQKAVPSGPPGRPDHQVEDLKAKNYQLHEEVCNLSFLLNSRMKLKIQTM